ncbi:MAG TPA: hypothetical protein VFY48_00715 [Solirubrobacterales bacterium]|nr:hypothetical protein [Solirubrobacterales bacterium]
MSADLLTALRECGVEDLLPEAIERQLAALGLQGETSLLQGDLEVLEGIAVPAAGATLPSLSGLPLEAAQPAGDLPVQIAVQQGGGAAPRWAVDLDLDPLTLSFPGLRPAQEVVQPGRPTVLAEQQAGGSVRIVGRAALRIGAAGGGTPRVSLLDGLHPADPFGPHGTVPSLRLDPPSFFLGDSEFGFTVEELGFDDSGLTLRRATLFLPPGAPVVGDVSLSVSDLFLGNPVGVKGTASAELGGPGDPPPAPPFGVRIEVAWDDPNARGLAEAVPSRADATVSLPGSPLALPGGGTATVVQPGSGAPPQWKLRGHWGHDRSTGADEFTLALDADGSPDGIAAVAGAPLAGGLGLAPAVIGAVDDVDGDAAMLGALIAALGAATTLLLRDESRVAVTGIEIDHLERGAAGPGSRTRLTVDYSVELSVEVGATGSLLQVLTRPGQPMRLRYRGVGVEVDTAETPWYDGIGLSFDGAVPEVVDPGSWKLGPPLDDLLRVLGVRSGAGSGWLEVDLAMAADLGVVKLSTATVRVVFGAGGIEGVELRGLRAAVDLPAVLKGEGALDVGNQAIHAGVQLEVVPLKLAAVAELAIGADNFVELEIGVRFPAPLPFANSGLGLFGVMGRFVANGRRDVDLGIADPVRRELRWLADPPPKYAPQRGQYALGLGAVVGTVPDAGVTFNARGMLSVEFPRPAVIFSVVAQILGGPAPVPSERVGEPGAGVSIVGLIVIDPGEGVTIALRGHYEVPHLLVLDIPVGAWFPVKDPAASWVHVGSDDQPGREGSPVTMELLPTILKQKVWAFAMVHGDGLSPGLMGKPDFAFEGFSIGFGAGWEIDWSAGPIRLYASAMVLAGFGTSPLRLAAGIWVQGSLDLVVVSISARGNITLLTSGERTRLKGEFCGEVDLFFFSLSGCVGIEIGDKIDDVGPPGSPVSGVDLVSRLGHATAAAVREGTGEPPSVWPDTVPVIHFAHVADATAVEGDFQIGTPMAGPVWSGSRELKYAYRIAEVRVEAVDGTPFVPPPGRKFESAWWWPGVRSTTAPSAALSATGIETRDLALLSWEPWTGLLPLTEPAQSPANPAAPIEEVCEPVSRAATVCLHGELGHPAGPGRATVPEPAAAAEKAGRPPTRLRVSQPGDADWDDVLAASATLGVAVEGAGVVPLDEPFVTDAGEELQAGHRLAGLAVGGATLGSLSAAGSFEPPLEDASLVLEVCRGIEWEGEGWEPGAMEEETLATLRAPSACTMLSGLGPEQLAEDADASGAVRWSGLTLAAESGEPLEAEETGDGWGLRVPGDGLRVRLPEAVDAVRVGFAAPVEAELVAFDHNGDEIAAATSEGEGEELTVEAQSIAAVRVRAREGALLDRVCTPDSFGVSTALLRPRVYAVHMPAYPGVVGVRTDGEEESWEPTPLNEDEECVQVRYEAPSAGPWAGLRIGPAQGRRVKIVSACGVRWHEALERRLAERNRVELIDALTLHASGLAETSRGTVAAQAALPIVLVGPPPRTLFAAAKTYRVVVRWEWQSCKPSGGTAPPPPDPNAWKEGGTDSFAFSTAAAAPSTPVDLIGERSFDPRSTARYVAGSEPSGELPPLLDDPVRVFFTVDYLPALLRAYGYEARIEVHPTDVAPGSLHFDPHAPNVVAGIEMVSWIGGLLRPTEEVIVGAVGASPCVPDTSLGGLAAEVKAGLEPETAYDLTLRARPGGGGEDSVISRFHFRTSRYRDTAELLGALGFEAGAAVGAPPPDVLLDSWSQPDGAPYDDFALQRTLTGIGLDPWPLSAAPRATTLWARPYADAAWHLAGLLLEAPEPIARPGRIEVSGSVGASPLRHLGGTATGTRVLLAPGAPVLPGPADLLGVRLQDRLRVSSVEGSVELLGVPGTIRQEVG